MKLKLPRKQYYQIRYISKTLRNDSKLLDQIYYFLQGKLSLINLLYKRKVDK